jgi:anti-anti-sigma factor
MLRAGTTRTMQSRADLHMHTTFSDGTLEPEDILNYYAVHPGISVIAITDHDTLDGALRVRDHREQHPDVYGALDVIVGEEVSSRDGHIVGLFLESLVPSGLSAADTVARIHEQDGLAIAVHPYTHLMEFAGLKGVGDLICTLPFDAVETRNANITELYSNLWAQRQARRHGLCEVGSSDGHFDDAIGRCYTLFEGTSTADLRRAIAAKETRAAGRVYGPLTLSRYVWRRWKAGQPILPRRANHVFEDRATGFRITVSDLSNLEVVVMRCEGSLDAASAPMLKEKLLFVARASLDLVVSLAGITRLDSSGLTCLIAGLKASRRAGRRFAIADISMPARQVLAAARVLDVFDVYASEHEALAAPHVPVAA